MKLSQLRKIIREELQNSKNSNKTIIDFFTWYMGSEEDAFTKDAFDQMLIGDIPAEDYDYDGENAMELFKRYRNAKLYNLKYKKNRDIYEVSFDLPNGETVFINSLNIPFA